MHKNLVIIILYTDIMSCASNKNKENKVAKIKVLDKEDKIIEVMRFDTILSDFSAINKNKFKVSKCDNESLSILIDIPLCQSEKIQLGNRMENMISMFILRNTQLKNIKEKNRREKRN